jgi:signal peptidase I
VTAALVLAVAVVLVAGAGVWLRRRLLVITVDGTSMQPTFQPGDRVLLRRVRPDRLRNGQIVVGVPGPPGRPLPRRPPLLVIKRLAAGPGDPVPRRTVPALASVPEPVVPAGRFVVLGDNPTGTDSRQLGYFYAQNLLGVVVRRLSPAESPVRPG